MKTAPLMTRWATLVEPTAPLPEYPRPQLVRKEWLNLNGIWEFQKASAGEAPKFGEELAGSILVPFPVESALSGVMEHHDRLWYRRTLTIPAGWQGKRILLHFGAVDYESEAFLNGHSLGLHKGGYDAFSYDITDFLTKDSSQELIVRVFDPTDDGGQPRGKQTTRPRRIMYTPTTGIWQTVWLEPVDLAHIESLTITPDIDHGKVQLTVHASASTAGTKAHVVIKDGDRMVCEAEAEIGVTTDIAIPSPKLWSPDSPFLYDLKATLGKSGDSVGSYFGMRKISLGKVNGMTRMMLNNEFVFQLGPLDQGFWPDGIYTPPTDDAIRCDIAKMKELGYNMVRKHIKVEPARWYYWTDKLGLLVWQDMPSANSYVNPASTPPTEDKAEFEDELKRMIEAHKSITSIVVWVVFNEGQGQFDTGRMVDIVRKLDPSRLINEASGNDVTGAGDINDIHAYPEPSVRRVVPNQAMACGEFGGIGYLVLEHSWGKRGTGYSNIETPTDLVCLYAEFIEKLKLMRDQRNLSAAVYTQLTDVEMEVNGLLTYDRLDKVAAETIRRVNRFEFKLPRYGVLMPTSEESGQTWKFTIDDPGPTWIKPSFDDAHWHEGTGIFGNDPHARTPWLGNDLWMRKHFNPGKLTTEDLDNIVTRDFHTGEADLYINGVKSFPYLRSSEGYENRAIKQDARHAIVPEGDNVIAIHFHPKGTGRSIDVGLYLREKVAV
jgi:hypothetical protein